MRASLERPVGSRGINDAPELAIEGRGPKEIALWLRWRPILLCENIEAEDDGRGAYCRGGDGVVEMSSALPSNDSESRTLDDEGEALSSIRPGQEFGCGALKLAHVSIRNLVCRCSKLTWREW